MFMYATGAVSIHASSNPCTGGVRRARKLTEVHGSGTVGDVLPGVVRGCIWGVGALAHVHDVQAVELLDAELVGQLVGDVVANVVQDAGGLALKGAGNGGCRGPD